MLDDRAFADLATKLTTEIKIAFPDQKFSERQLGEEVQKLYNRITTPKHYMTLVIAHCIYNEAQFMKECLYDDLKINDVDIIHIMDGAWKHFEGGEASNDGTIEIIKEFKEKAEKVGIQVIYENHPSNKIWNSESEKRNYQFKRIHEICGKDPHYIMVKDGDEFIHPLSGRKNFWMKMELLKIYMDPSPLKVGLIEANPWYFDNKMITPRLFPSNEQFHYYTEKSMAIHDGNCNMVADYNPQINNIDTKRCYLLKSFIFINRLHIREKNRRDAKNPFVKHLTSQINTTDKCKFLNLSI